MLRLLADVEQEDHDHHAPDRDAGCGGVNDLREAHDGDANEDADPGNWIRLVSRGGARKDNSPSLSIAFPMNGASDTPTIPMRA